MVDAWFTIYNSTNAYYDVINELTDFIEITDIIVANRLDEELKNVSDKVISIAIQNNTAFS